MRRAKIVVAIVVGDVVDVRDVCIGDVDIAKIAVTHVSAAISPSAGSPMTVSPATVARIERLTPAQREPAKANTEAKAPTAAPSKADTEAASSDPADQGRSVIGIPVSERSGSPAPSAVPVDPASIVERRKSPGSIIHPSPSPRLDPRPMTVAVGRPSCLDRAVPRPSRTQVRFAKHRRRRGPDSQSHPAKHSARTQNYPAVCRAPVPSPQNHHEPARYRKRAAANCLH